jgi:hypothetical protein
MSYATDLLRRDEPDLRQSNENQSVREQGHKAIQNLSPLTNAMVFFADLALLFDHTSTEFGADHYALIAFYMAPISCFMYGLSCREPLRIIAICYRFWL